jgi:hypothetical protein
MRDIIDELIEDDSNREAGIIHFIVRCKACDEIWSSRTTRFSMAGKPAENKNKEIVYDAMWQKEWGIERNNALDEAAKHFNLCPICKRLSCEKCFRICDTIDMCASCAQRLGETGEAVEDEFIEPHPSSAEGFAPVDSLKESQQGRKKWRELWLNKSDAPE